MEIIVKPYGEISGQVVEELTITNDNNISVSVLTYGCIVNHIKTPDRNGNLADIVLGYENLDKYLAGHPFFGAIAGRYANRIKDGQFTLDGNMYQLTCNEEPTGQHLHGGGNGFDKKVWGYNIEEKDNAIMIHLHRVSPDNEANYPGNLNVIHTVGLDNDNQLHMNFHATTDKPTVLNLVNHGYYNLSGHDQGTIHHQELQILADYYTPITQNLIPTGEIYHVEGTGFDFRTPTVLSKNMQKMPNELIDHNFVLSCKEKEGDYHKAAELYDPKTGRVMTVLTTQPGVQFYNAGKLSNRDWYGKDNHKYESFEGLCLETQHFPDSPNQAHFPSTTLYPGDVFEEKNIHRFTVR